MIVRDRAVHVDSILFQKGLELVTIAVVGVIVGVRAEQVDRHGAARKAAQVTRGRHGQSPFERAERRGPEETGLSRAAGWTQTGVASTRCFSAISCRAFAHAIVEVEELTSMTDEPVIVERDEAGNVTVGERSNDGRRKTGQVRK